jgi:hypothetical protein
VSLVVVAAAVAGATLHTPAARASQGSLFDLELIGQPLYYQPGTRGKNHLDLVLRVRNHSEDTLRGFAIELQAGTRVSSRSQLHAIFGGASFSIFGEQRYTFVDRSVPPGGVTEVRIGDRLDVLPSLPAEGSGYGGVYPVRVSLHDLSTEGTELDAFTTPLVVYPQTPNPRLTLVPVLAVSEIPSREPDGAFRENRSGQIRVAGAVQQGGRLLNLLRGLEKATATGRLGIAVAASPRTLEEIEALGRGFRVTREGKDRASFAQSSKTARAAKAWLLRFRRAVATPGVQPLPVLYSSPDIPTLARELAFLQGSDPLADQLAEARKVFDAVLGRPLEDGWLYPSNERLDHTSLEALGAVYPLQSTFFSSDVLAAASEGCPEESGTGLTFACPVEVETSRGNVTGFVADEDLQRRLAGVSQGGRGDLLSVREFFAETAMIREELPNLSGRVVQVTIPPDWAPTEAGALRLLRGLARAPWLKTSTPQEALDRALGRGYTVAARDVVDRATTPRSAPDSAYWEQIASDLVQLGHFLSMQPPSGLVQMLRRDLLTAESREWWRSPRLQLRGTSYTDYVRDRASDVQNAIGLPEGDHAQTFTSHQGKLQLVVFNRAPFPLRVRIVLRTDKLRLEKTHVERTIHPGTQSLSLSAGAQGSGAFPVSVAVTTPDGNPIASQVIVIRSTTYNRIALGITAGAFAFLVLFYAARALGSRRRHSEGEGRDEVTGGGVTKA